MDIEVANSFFKRLRGLMFKENYGKNKGMLFLKTRQVHSFFMKFDIYVVYLDKDFKVLDLELLRPGKIGRKISGTKHILELSSDCEMGIDSIEKNIKDWRQDYGGLF